MLRGPIERNPIVAVPVRNEAQRLPTLLNALAAQSWIAVSQEPLQVVLVLNNCTDQTGSVATTFAAATSKLSIDIVETHFAAGHAHVGSARGLAMDRAFAIGGANDLLLTTDADAFPSLDWIGANLRAVAAGADLVGGHIVGNPEEEAALGTGFQKRARRQMRYNRLVDHLTALLVPLAHDPWPRHSDHTGASLAVKSEVYEKLGGIPPLPCREDVTFVKNALQAGFQLRHPLDVKVEVSARLDGRAKGGMAECIRGWLRAEQHGLPHLVEDPTYILHRLQKRAPGAIIMAHEFSAATVANANRISNVKGPDIDVGIAIARLEGLVAENGIRCDVA
jgi:glycosyltransferase involved in cell wall biosynthesis